VVKGAAATAEGEGEGEDEGEGVGVWWWLHMTAARHGRRASNLAHKGPLSQGVGV
jgi:hypothetical protein